MKKHDKTASPIPYLSQRGLGRVLGDLELEVMETLWAAGPPISGREIHDRLARRRDWAYTTIRTVVDRLVEKGLLRRRKDDGVWHYAPALSREAFRTMVSREAVRGALEFAPEATITQLVDLLTEGDSATLDELERLVARARAAREGNE